MKIDSMIGHRLVRPRFILWMGSTFEPDAALLADLPSIPFAAVFQKSKFESVERVLAQPAVRERRWTVVISDGDELDAWKPSQPALIYVEGREGGSLPPRRQLARHFAMLHAGDLYGSPGLRGSSRPAALCLGATT